MQVVSILTGGNRLVRESPHAPAGHWGVRAYEQQVSDALANAWMGITYWARLVDTSEPTEPAEFESDYPLKGGSLTLQDVDGEKHVLDGEALKKGLAVMLAKYPRRYAEMITGGGDARTGDVLVQCCLLGEVIYS